ncbi:MAG: protein phosphatase CheZ [Thermodesulfobacteriota bacterium]|nr:protein phosphatase CheZ [Thermodesulfobacteriota bacterium]
MKKNLKERIDNIVDGNLTSDQMEKLIIFLRETMSNGLAHDDDPFFKNLVYEMTGDVKDLALMIIDFKKDLKSKIHPELTDLAMKHIPQAADQLEAIIETTEMAANKIMDNLDSMQGHMDKMKNVVASLKKGKIKIPKGENKFIEIDIDGQTIKTISPFLNYMESNIQDHISLISDSFMQMSFQDLTGQRIKRIINLVNEMENKIKDMVISFGIKLTAIEKNPEISRDELERAVGEKVIELAGPQRAGQGLDQSGIDDLLASL